MPAPAPALPTVETIRIVPLPDPVIDSLGHDPRSLYVETFWLSILGPSTTWLMRRLAAGLDRHPEGFDLPLAETARSLGLGDKGGRHSPFMRALSRCVQFDLATLHDDELAVRRRIPPLNRRQLVRLPEHVQQAHQAWLEREQKVPPVEAMRRRGCQLALSLLDLGEDGESAERQLLRWRFHPAMARECVGWAVAHRAQRPSAPATPPVPAAAAGAPVPA